ncbi:MAG: T9SS type A sorting domain-containing protein [Rhodothermales bacterium]|nr:T9SS type A sorting domain-containing protein [Rhodothermales bacterium]
MKNVTVRCILLLLPVMVANRPAAYAQLMGPTGGSGADGEYNQASDSPFFEIDFSTGYFHLEDFEDGFDVPGVTADNGGVVSVIFGPGLHDSVDADDGVVDGSGLDGENWFYIGGATGITWTFDPTLLLALPTHAGLVWTDGAGDIIFEAFDAAGTSLGTVVGQHSCCGFDGATAEDRFYGVIEPAGISAIKISSNGGGIEIDHLQYGRMDVSNVAIETPGRDGASTAAPILFENYPEPFQGLTTLTFSVPNNTPVRVEVVNVLGQIVQVPYDQWANPGTTAVQIDLSGLRSGIYLYRMVTPSGIVGRQMIHTK